LVDMADAGGPRLVKSEPLTAAYGPNMRSRWIVEPDVNGWGEFALSEWELRAAGWSDHHPHSETNLVVEGELHVECGGQTVVASAGDAVTVPAGQVGRYWAPTYARMFAIYGPNPDAEATKGGEYWSLAP
jgi:mannose-6-phosphate isomerase-like protein (cupin superfamily)